MLELHYYKENEDNFVKREVEPYQLVNGPEGWYLGCYDLGPMDTRHFRLDRMKAADDDREGVRAARGHREQLDRAGVAGHGEVSSAASPASGSRPSVRAGFARSARSSRSLPTAPSSSSCRTAREWLGREILKGAGDLVVLEPDDAREAVLAAVSA